MSVCEREGEGERECVKVNVCVCCDMPLYRGIDPAALCQWCSAQAVYIAHAPARTNPKDLISTTNLNIGCAL